MACLSIRVSDERVEELGECEECGAKHGRAPSAGGVEDPSSAGLSQMMAAVKVLLQGIGEDVARDGLLDTPLRVASAFRGALAGYQLSAEKVIGKALFSEVGTVGGSGCGGGSGGIVVVRNIDSFALCESCLLPFRLRCHVVYIPCGQRVVGLSKLPRVAEIFAKRLQNPQKFADQLVQALNESIRPLGVGVVVESWHLQWPGVSEGSGIRKGGDAQERLGFGWVPASVYAGKGQFENLRSTLWDEFLIILQLEGVDVERPTSGATDGHSGRRKSCPFLVYDGQGVSSLGIVNSSLPEVTSNGSSGQNSLPHSAGFTMSTVSASAANMAVGVESLLRAMGEDPSTEELRCTALRFVNWILMATQGSRGFIANGQDNGLNTGVNGTAGFGHATGSFSYGNFSVGNGCSKGNWLRGSMNGFTTQSNGTGYGSSLRQGSSTNCYGSSPLKDGMLGGGVTDMNHHVASGNVIGNQHARNGALRPDNGAFGESKCAFSKGRCSTKVDTISKVENFSGDLVCLEMDISFSSLCEHHLLPFFGMLHLGYITGKGSQHIDRSVVVKIVATYSRRLQVQERLTRQIVEEVVSLGGLQGAVVVVEASHMCIMSRGVEKLGSSTATVATIGKFSSDGDMRAAFLKKISTLFTYLVS